MIEPKRVITIDESEFNSLTLIARKRGYVYPRGHTHAGKMNTAQTVKYLIHNFEAPIA
jgi:hypothetical protein